MGGGRETENLFGVTLGPHLLQSCPPARGVHIPNLKEIAQAISKIRVAKVLAFSLVFFFPFFLVFSHTCKNCYKTQVCTLIALKFGTERGSPKANLIIKFGVNLMNHSITLSKNSILYQATSPQSFDSATSNPQHL